MDRTCLVCMRRRGGARRGTAGRGRGEGGSGRENEDWAAWFACVYIAREPCLGIWWEI